MPEERGHDEGIPPLVSQKGVLEPVVPFYNSVIRNFMVYQERFVTKLYAAIRALRKFRMVFYNFSYSF